MSAPLSEHLPATEAELAGLAKIDHGPGNCWMCRPLPSTATGYWQSGAAMRDQPLPAAPVWVRGSR